MSNITFSTCWYILKAKFDVNVYLHWIDNMLSNVNNYYLVIYSDENSSKYLEKYLHNPKIKLIIKPLEKFHNYKYKEKWIHNHTKNIFLNQITDWQVNMLWSEKIWFVDETIRNKYFNETNDHFYGWCDIGYFRNRKMDTIKEQLINWPSNEKINNLDKNKIHYACVNNDGNYLNYLHQLINNKNSVGLPNTPIPPQQVSIAGGFFILHKNKINDWKNMYDNKLQLYFENDYLVKDDQMIISDCVFSNNSHFQLYEEKDSTFDNWFLFQRFFMPISNQIKSNITSNKISVLIPIYNGVEFIDESISSVLNQTYTDWEIILGINGHPQNSTVYQTVEKYIYNLQFKETLLLNKSNKIQILDLYQINTKPDALNEMLKYGNSESIAI